MPQQPYVLADGLTYQLSPDRTLFQDVQICLAAGDPLRNRPFERIALVGANGVGKSTLLKILAGQIQPSAGSVWRNGSIYYLPQISTIRPQIKADTVLNFLSAVAEEWWKITDVLETQFSTPIDLSVSIAQLSGGELTKLFLAIGLFQQPNVLLLDEPTNHMDYPALEELRQCLTQFQGA
ncbi:MAG TPA: ATP-binding cassette domain-containing protein, partial [Coleofasciculaceae cyanobacterium]